MPTAQRHSAHRAKHGESRQSDRHADDATSGLRSQPAQTQTDRGMLRLDEDDRGDAEDAAQRNGASGLDVHLHRSGVQPGADPKPAGGSDMMRAMLERVPSSATTGLEADQNRAIPGDLPLQRLFNRSETASQGRISAPC